MPFGIKVKFVPDAFLHDFIRRKATRSLKEFLDKVGAANIVWCIEHDRQLFDYLPAEVKQHYQMGIKIRREYADEFKDGEVYSWIPLEYQRLIEAYPNGKQWAFGHFPVIRSLVIPS